MHNYLRTVVRDFNWPKQYLDLAENEKKKQIEKREINGYGWYEEKCQNLANE